MLNKVKTLADYYKKGGFTLIAEKTRRAFRRRMRRIIHRKPMIFRLQGDLVMRKLLKFLVGECNISFIIETGSYKGHTTTLFGEMFPHLKVYSCEIDPENYLDAKINTHKFKNIKIYNISSNLFLKEILNKKEIGSKPLFFLDAHWLDFWPLEDEMKIIGKMTKEAIIIIDDFKIPNETRYEYDDYKDKECSIDMINPNLKKGNNYNLLLPKYGIKAAYNSNIPHNPWLIGHAVIFQNMNKQFNKIIKNEFIKNNFNDATYLIKK